MDHPQPLTPAFGDAYRLEKANAFFVWVVLSVAMAASVAAPYLSFVLAPFAFVFTRLNPFRFLVVWIAAALFFLETYRSSFIVFTASDALPLTYFLLLLLFALPRDLRLSVPVNASFVFLYLFLLQAIALAPIALANYPATYVITDLKFIFLLALVPVLVGLEGPRRQPKKIFLLLGAVILFSTLHALEIFASFLLLQGGRPTTWSGVFVVSAVVFCFILLDLPFSHATRRKLRIALGVCLVGVLLIQTRGLWLSTLVCVALFFIGKILSAGPRKALGRFVRITLVLAVGLVILSFVFPVFAGVPLQEFVTRRSGDLDLLGFLDPYSSMGYRIHESWAVWDERTFWGHGPGATLNLFFTQLNKSEFMDWWSIHSGYFEILHKQGFVGVFLMGGMGLALSVSAWRLVRRKKKWERAAGAAVLLMLFNHAVYSITSNEFNRPTSPIMWFLAFYITWSMAPKRKAATPTPAPEP
jgi:hypothetical protein